MKVKIKSIFGFFLGSAVIATAHAQIPYPNYPFITLTGGIAQANFDQNLYFGPSVPMGFYDYVPSSGSQTTSIFGIYMGRELLITPCMALQVGVSYNQPSTWDFSGDVTQGADNNSSNTYNYSYNVNSYQILAEGKLLFYPAKTIYTIYPYISAGIGSAYNRFSNYNVDIDPAFTTLSNEFPSNGEFSFSYSVGVGVEIELPTKTMGLGVGYRFSDFGSVQSGNSTINNQPTSNQISNSHLLLNEIVMQFTWVFN